MVTLSVLIVAAALPDARADLLAALGRYKTLKSYSATVESQDASGLYPGHYVLSLKWSGDGKFEIKVVEPTKPVPTEPWGIVPSYSSDGKIVTRTQPDGYPSSSPLNTDPNITPGYEVACGPVLSALLGSPRSRLFVSPPSGMEIRYSYGKQTEWKGTNVKEIVLSIVGPRSRTSSFFLSADGKWIVGFAYELNEKKSFLHYIDAKYEE